MKTYVEKLFESCKSRSPRLYKNVTLEGWLGTRIGNVPRREMLLDIGKRAAKIGDLEAARADWRSYTGGGQIWVRDFIGSIPLLFENTVRSQTDDKVFRQHMKNLATLAKL